MLIAHRGLYSEDIMENSIEAFDNAFKNGYDGIEFDVRLSKDKVPIVFHDSFLLRVTSLKGFIHDYSFRELKKYGIPSLEMVINRYKNKIMFIELKEEIDILKYLNNRNNYYISSFNKDYIYRINRGKYKLGVINYILNNNLNYSKIDFVMILDSLFNYKIYNYYFDRNIEVVIYGVIGNINKSLIKDLKYII